MTATLVYVKEKEFTTAFPFSYCPTDGVHLVSGL